MQAKTYYAHSVAGQPQELWQPLSDHLYAVAAGAAHQGAKFGAARATFLAGLLHDLGKYTPGFQRRLAGGVSVDHATAGAQLVAQLPGVHPAMRTMLAHVLAGHHAGLSDSAGLQERLDKAIEAIDPIWRNEVVLDAKGLIPKFEEHVDLLGFQLSFLGRMIFSCLIDADRRDTAAFEARSNGNPPPAEATPLSDILDRARAAFDSSMAGKTKDGPLNALRWRVLAHVRDKAALPPGLFTLTVPTGGGKTLASLGFALDHAKIHAAAYGFDRIIYAIPFTSVIDQTVGILEDVLGKEVVLAHHSGFDLGSAADEDEFHKVEENRLRLTMQSWAMPVVVTTNVQFFESLFSHRPSRCRKLQSIARSIIVLDEAQTIPLHVLRPCLAALDELARNYGCTIVLCTATQPAVTQPTFKGGLIIPAERELAPDPTALHEQLRRVTMRQVGILTDEALVAELAGPRQGLVIVNTRGHALKLYDTARTTGLDGLIHLTTRHYAAHRRTILDDVRQRLRDGRPCRLIATSLVEAGVDLDFTRVWRAEAGLDSIVQSAGRCNREGKRDRAESIVTVFTPAEARPPREIKEFIGDAARAALDFDDLLSPVSVKRYFREVYWRKDKALDQTCVPDGTIEVLDKTTFGVTAAGCSFEYRTVGENFRLIAEGMAPVIVANDDQAKAALGGLRHDNARVGSVARQLQPFIVQIPPKARALLLAHGHVAFVEKERFGNQFCALRTENFYTNDTGLLWENHESLGFDGIFS